MKSPSKYITSLFPQKMSREVKELYFSTVLMDLGLAMVSIFEPIYLYSIGYSLQSIVLFFLIVYVLYLIIMPLGARFACYFGSEKSIVVSTIFITLLYLSLYGIQFEPQLFFVAAIMYALQKALYWPAYHADFSKNITIKEGGREVSGFNASSILIYVIGPIIAGAIISFGGFVALFTVAIVIFIISNIPLLTTKEVFTRHHFSYVESFKTLFSQHNFNQLRAYLGYAEEVVLLVVWPVFMSVIVKDNFEIGLIAGVSLFLSMVVTLLAGKFIDTNSKRALLNLSSIIYAVTWFFKIMVRTPIGVFVVGSASWLAKNVVELSVIAITYSRAHQGKIMSKVVAFESGLVLGKLAMLLFLYLTFGFVENATGAFNLSFISAGFTSLLYMLL